MAKLLNYSIETDQTILLHYADGRDLRVSLQSLAEYVSKEEEKKIYSALQLRETFFKRHLPKVGILLILGGLIGFGGEVQQQRLQQITNPTAISQLNPSTDQFKSALSLPVEPPRVASPEIMTVHTVAENSMPRQVKSSQVQNQQVKKESNIESSDSKASEKHPATQDSNPESKDNNIDNSK